VVFKLEPYGKIKSDLLFWIREWLYHKAITLSTSKVIDKKKYRELLSELEKDNISTIKKIDDIVLSLRKNGMEGVKTYYIPARSFYQWVVDEEIKTVSDITNKTLLKFLTVQTVDKSDATKKNYRNVIGNLFSFIEKHNFIEDKDKSKFYRFGVDLSSWQGLSGKSGQKAPAYLTEDEVYQYLSFIEDSYPFKTDTHYLFYNLIIKIIFYSGMRISEALELRWKDIVKNNKKELYTITIKGKGNKERTIYIKSTHIEKLLEQWKLISPCKRDGYLFCNLKNGKEDEPMLAATVSMTIAKTLKEIGFSPKKKGAHLLRHTYASLMYKKTKDLVLVQEALGHSDPATTNIYTHIDDERKEKGAEIMN